MINRFMTPENFEKRLHDIKQGNPPDSMVELNAYVSDSLRELRSYTEALAECVQRQKFTLDVVRKLNHALEDKNKQLTHEIASLKAEKAVREGGHL